MLLDNLGAIGSLWGMTRHIAIILVGLLLPGPAPALAQDAGSTICVSNQTEGEHLFVVEARGGARSLRQIKPGEQLCIPSDGPGTVAVFDDINSIEGCTRLATPGRPKVLLEFANFDNCRWQDQSE